MNRNDRVHTKVRGLWKIKCLSFAMSNIYYDWAEAESEEDLIDVEAKADAMIAQIKEVLEEDSDETD